jgi:hypothetical protein
MWLILNTLKQYIMTKVSDNKDTNKKKMIKALVEAKGIVLYACEATGLSRSNHYTWMDNDPKYKAAVDEVQEITIEYVENKLMNLIDSDNVSATMFYLRNRSKAYGEKLEVSGDISVAAINIIKPKDAE